MSSTEIRKPRRRGRLFALWLAFNSVTLFLVCDFLYSRRLFIPGDVHLSADGNRLAFRLLANHLL
jgi:hypothetical protein